jgi:succinyl-CoA synthetase beta subunit
VVRALKEEVPLRPGFPIVILIAGNKEKESLEIVREGIKGLNGRIEVYGREHVYDVDFIARRVKALVEEYRGKR